MLYLIQRVKKIETALTVLEEMIYSVFSAENLLFLQNSRMTILLLT